MVSSLALHDARDDPGRVARIARWLAAARRLVYSTEDPIDTARAWVERWVIGPEGTRLDGALDHYAQEGPREHRWFGHEERRHQRTLATLLNGLIAAGLVIKGVREATPSAGPTAGPRTSVR